MSKNNIKFFVKYTIEIRKTNRGLYYELILKNPFDNLNKANKYNFDLGSKIIDETSGKIIDRRNFKEVEKIFGKNFISQLKFNIGNLEIVMGENPQNGLYESSVEEKILYDKPFPAVIAALKLYGLSLERAKGSILASLNDSIISGEELEKIKKEEREISTLFNFLENNLVQLGNILTIALTSQVKNLNMKFFKIPDIQIDSNKKTAVLKGVFYKPSEKEEKIIECQIKNGYNKIEINTYTIRNGKKTVNKRSQKVGINIQIPDFKEEGVTPKF